MKGKSTFTPPNGSNLSPPGTSGDNPHTPNSHPNAALDTLIPANIEPILIKPTPSDGTSPTGVGDPPRTPTFSPDGVSAPPHGTTSPFSSLALNPLTQAGLDEIIQRLLTTAYSAKITKNFCLRTHEITALCQGSSVSLIVSHSSRSRVIHVSADSCRVDAARQNCRRCPWPIRRFN